MGEYKKKLEALGYDSGKTKAMLEKYRTEYDGYRKKYEEWVDKYGNGKNEYEKAAADKAKFWEDPDQRKLRMLEAQRMASEDAQRMSAAAGQTASSQARAMGLTPAQAALLGSQQVGGLFTQQYGGGLERAQGLQQRDFDNQMKALNQAATYRQADIDNAMRALQGAQSATAGGAGLAQSIGNEDFRQIMLDLQKITTQAGMDQNALNAYLQEKGIDSGVAMQQGQQTAGLVGGLFSGLAGLLPLLLSDENQKDISPKDPVGALDSVIRSIGSHVYKYKKGSGENPDTDHYGPTAQEIEQTPLRDAVQDTPQGKMVDTRRLALGNTSLIAELGKKVDDLYGYIKENRNGR